MIMPSSQPLFIDLGYNQLNKYGQDICGDAFTFCKTKDEQRSIAVLSDGLGSGVKANILASMTATMALKFAKQGSNVRHFAEIMMSALPICKVRGISYATFTIVDTDSKGRTTLIEMGNPESLLIRGGERLQLDYKLLTAPSWRDREIRLAQFTIREQDRLIFFSDGVTQAGMGSAKWKLGWRLQGCCDFVQEYLRRNPAADSHSLTSRILGEAISIEDGKRNKDDATCMALHFRKAHRMLLATGPAYHNDRDDDYARKVVSFAGTTVICGGTTAQIIARQQQRELETDLASMADGIPPSSRMDGVDLITEGILTLSRVVEYLKKKISGQKNPAGELVDMMRRHDIIEFLVGTRVNEAHQDPTLPEDLELRRNIVKNIAAILRRDYLKEIVITYV